ncbi:hypothetical protein CEXT_761721 [Caerostris extrusa]|uniref:Uncharacterized protein n=1 Tax=Caerostris extrusa TaxID=172846 RepID=A0AAV4PG88_CAEEX|nr:hypothetical protein CEXT_761721 [Caerostris extrusa]
MSWAFSREETPVTPIYLEGAVIRCFFFFFSSLERLALKQNCYLCVVFDVEVEREGIVWPSDLSALLEEGFTFWGILPSFLLTVFPSVFFQRTKSIKVGLRGPCGLHLFKI